MFALVLAIGVLEIEARAPKAPSDKVAALAEPALRADKECVSGIERCLRGQSGRVGNFVGVIVNRNRPLVGGSREQVTL